MSTLSFSLDCIEDYFNSLARITVDDWQPDPTVESADESEFDFPAAVDEGSVYDDEDLAEFVS